MASKKKIVAKVFEIIGRLFWGLSDSNTNAKIMKKGQDKQLSVINAKYNQDKV